MLKSNLSTRPFYNERLVNLLLVLAAIAGLALAVFNATRLLELGQERSARVATQDKARAEAAALRSAADREHRSVDRNTLMMLAAATGEANALIDERTFSWTEFFGLIEKTLPLDVRLLGVAPRAERDALRIDMRINSKRADDLEAFMDALNSTGSFYDLIATDQTSVDDGTISATFSGKYFAPVLKSTKVSGPAGGPERP
jgi:hypothetical protein